MARAGPKGLLKPSVYIIIPFEALAAIDMVPKLGCWCLHWYFFNVISAKRCNLFIHSDSHIQQPCTVTVHILVRRDHKNKISSLRVFDLPINHTQ